MSQMFSDDKLDNALFMKMLSNGRYDVPNTGNKFGEALTHAEKVM